MKNFDALTCATGLGMRCISFLTTSTLRLTRAIFVKIGRFLAEIQQTAPCMTAGFGQNTTSEISSRARLEKRAERKTGDRAMNHVTGEKKGEVILYALSTCIWCKKTKNVLNKLGVQYSYVDLDLLEQDDQIKVLSRLAIFNPSLSLPTLVIDENVIIGDDEERIYELLA
jgi:glutaredoxin-like protein NrdH